MSKRLLALLIGTALALATLPGCENTSPGNRSADPPPPPTRTPTGLRHRPNSGLRPMSNELSEEDAAAMLGETPPSEEEGEQNGEGEGEQTGNEEAIPENEGASGTQ